MLPGLLVDARVGREQLTADGRQKVPPEGYSSLRRILAGRHLVEAHGVDAKGKEGCKAGGRPSYCVGAGDRGGDLGEVRRVVDAAKARQSSCQRTRRAHPGCLSTSRQPPERLVK